MLIGMVPVNCCLPKSLSAFERGVRSHHNWNHKVHSQLDDIAIETNQYPVSTIGVWSKSHAPHTV
jgi:hypothetical protein